MISTNIFSQSVESIVERVSNEICDCIGEIEDKSELRKKLKECSDEKINFIMNNSTEAENEILLEGDNLKRAITQIEPYVIANCEKVKIIVTQNLNNEANKVAENQNIIPCPTNFTGKDLKKIKKLDGEIIAFNALVKQVSTSNNKPYYEVKLEGGNTIWVASLVNSGFEVEGKIIRLLGYVSKVGVNELSKTDKTNDYHVLAFCVIDLDSKQIALMPGSEVQVKEWMNGTVPKGKD